MLDLSPHDELITELVPFRNINGALLWLARTTRFDISKAVNQISRFCNAPTIRAWKAVKRIMRYLSETADFELVYTRDLDRDLMLWASADGSWAPNEFRDSVGGGAWMLGSSIISWFCRTTRSITLSTCETELVYIFEASKIGHWLIPLGQFLFGSVLTLPCVIYNDNQGAICIVEQGKYSQRTRHIQVKYLFTYQMIQAGTILVKWMSTDTLHADIFTKAFHPTIHVEKLYLFKGAFLCKGLFP